MAYNATQCDITQYPLQTNTMQLEMVWTKRPAVHCGYILTNKNNDDDNDGDENHDAYLPSGVLLLYRNIMFIYSDSD